MTKAHQEALCVSTGASPEADVEIHRTVTLEIPQSEGILALSFEDFRCALRSALCADRFDVKECADLASALATVASISAASFSDARLAAAFGAGAEGEAGALQAERPQFLECCLCAVTEELWEVLRKCDCVSPAEAALVDQAYLAVLGDELQFSVRVLYDPSAGETPLTCAQFVVRYRIRLECESDDGHAGA